MNMQEEYLKRHIIQTPIVKYVKEGYLFLKNKNKASYLSKSPWIIMSIVEAPQGNHPSDINVGEMLLDYNSCMGKNHNKNPHMISYNDYQSYLQSKIIHHIHDGYVPVFGSPNVEIAATEMIVYIWCTHILDTYGEAAVNSYYGLLDTNNEVDNKKSCLQKIQSMFLADKYGVSESARMFYRYCDEKLYCNWIKSWKLC